MTLEDVNRLSRPEFVAALGAVFEHSPWVADAAWERRPFGDLQALHRALGTALQAARWEKKLELIRAHPDLAGRLAQRGQLTDASRLEQASAGLDRLDSSEMAEFMDLNGRYRAKFGFPFVICARLNDRAAILAALRQRLDHSAEREQEAALAEIEKIAWLRLLDKVK